MALLASQLFSDQVAAGDETITLSCDLVCVCEREREMCDFVR